MKFAQCFGLLALCSLCVCQANELEKNQTCTATQELCREICVEEEVNAEIGIMVMAAVVLVSWFAETFFHHRQWTAIPEGVAAMVLGMVVSGAHYFYTHGDENAGHLVQLSPELFQLLFLPPIIFDAGFSLRKKGFLRNVYTISIYAIVGTLISTVITGLLTFSFLQMVDNQGASSSQTFFESMTFGALISAVDPIGSLAILSGIFKVDKFKDKNNPLLYNLVFGESVLNDAVAIVLFNSFAKYIHKDFTAVAVFEILGSFLLTFCGSLFFGIVFGLITTLLFKHSHIHNNSNFEIFTVFFMSYGSYVLCEFIHLSGIVAVFSCGVVQSHYTYYNLSNLGRILLPRIFSALASLSETIVFVYLGLGTFGFHTSHSWDIGFIVFSFVLCLFARAVAIFPLTACVNLKRKKQITFRQSVVLWFSGLRGAIAFVLVIEMQTMDAVYKNTFLSTTLVLVFATTVICGSLTKPLLECLNVMDDEDIEDINPPPATMSSRTFKSLDTRFLKPVLLRTLSPTEQRENELANMNGSISDTNKALALASVSEMKVPDLGSDMSYRGNPASADREISACAIARESNQSDGSDLGDSEPV